eukprot:536570_1
MTKKLKVILKQFTNSAEFNATLKEFGFDANLFSFEVLGNKHRNEAIDIISKQFSSVGGTIWSVVYGVSISDIYPEICMIVDHAINTQLSYVTLDHNNRIAQISILFDATDLPECDINTPPLNIQKRTELFHERDKIHPFIYHLSDNIKYGLIKPGDCICAFKAAVRHDLMSKGYSVFGGMSYALQIGMGYKYSYATLTHPATVHLAVNKFPSIFNKAIGDKVCFVSKFDIYSYIKNKFETDEWYQNNLDKDKILNYCQGKKLGASMYRFDLIAEKYDMKQFWKTFAPLMHSKRSKL